MVSIEILQRGANFEVYIEQDDRSFQVYVFDGQKKAHRFMELAAETFRLVTEVEVTQLDEASIPLRESSHAT